MLGFFCMLKRRYIHMPYEPQDTLKTSCLVLSTETEELTERKGGVFGTDDCENRV
jgi:hypothetical protein